MYIYIYIKYTYNELLAVVGGTPYHNTHTNIQHLSTIDIQNSYWVCHVDKWYIACSYLKYIYIYMYKWIQIHIYNYIYFFLFDFPFQTLSKPFPRHFVSRANRSCKSWWWQDSTVFSLSKVSFKIDTMGCHGDPMWDQLGCWTPAPLHFTMCCLSMDESFFQVCLANKKVYGMM